MLCVAAWIDKQASVSPCLRGEPHPKTLPEFHGYQRHHSQHCPDAPEADDDLGLRPALALEVVVEGGHEEDPTALAVALAGVLEVAHLEHHRQRLGHEDAAH